EKYGILDESFSFLFSYFCPCVFGFPRDLLRVQTNLYVYEKVECSSYNRGGKRYVSNVSMTPTVKEGIDMVETMATMKN
ncbi:unnamed protein product, partial [Prunus brigantina]